MYLDFIQSQLGFVSQWRKWIRACLQSARTSILVNGSLSLEFSIKRGLRQGDPLSPFLFIIVMEDLHLAINEVLQTNLIRKAFVEDVVDMARGTGYEAGSFPFKYLGLPIGSNMNCIDSWSHLVSKFNDKLSNWKANLFFIGERLTLIKVVLGSVGIYHMSIFKLPETTIRTLKHIRASFFWGGIEDRKKMAWVKWDSAFASLDKGGLERL
ncbi:putative RNA-directed DNA polymerase, eukaryota, reverse transcriptase zinc-binding domain protein [Tanacetum coccineum]|uniref:RNA-directed DNA polymerase, eukaryota, reverse transcriptase zinc-binding domain protein n=1 Tax=Tanacetum coccineum TaxID=301880 RepID=A0ABQ5HE41_9ASTR